MTVLDMVSVTHILEYVLVIYHTDHDQIVVLKVTRNVQVIVVEMEYVKKETYVNVITVTPVQDVKPSPNVKMLNLKVNVIHGANIVHKNHTKPK